MVGKVDICWEYGNIEDPEEQATGPIMCDLARGISTT